MLYIGRHVSISGGIDTAFDKAKSIGCTAMQIFATNPRGWKLSPIDAGSVAQFRAKASKTGIRTVVHMPYLPNIASSKKDIYEKSVESLTQNLDRCSMLGASYLVAHMGSHMGDGKEKGLGNIAAAIGRAVDASDSDTPILIENEAGHANSLGEQLADMASVAGMVGSRRLGFCLDTCHLFAAGYDIRSHDALDRMFSEIDIGMVHALHLNDAKMELGSHRDRHANIGFGYIGLEGFRSFLSYGGVQSKTILLETPISDEISEADEIAAVRLLCDPVRNK